MLCCVAPNYCFVVWRAIVRGVGWGGVYSEWYESEMIRKEKTEAVATSLGRRDS